MSHTVIGGPYSPNFKEYEMLKVAEKTEIFRKRPKETKLDILHRRKEWLIAFSALLLLAVLVVVFARVMANNYPAVRSYTNDQAYEFYQQIGKKENKVLGYLDDYNVRYESVGELFTADTEVYVLRGGIFGAGQTARIIFEDVKGRKYLASYTETLLSREWPAPDSGTAMVINNTYANLCERFGGPNFSSKEVADGEKVLDEPGAKTFEWTAVGGSKADCIFRIDLKDGFTATVSFTGTN